MESLILEGNIVDIISKRVYPGRIECIDGKIISVVEDSAITAENYILPGLIDSHVHIESSMLPPSEFARLAVVHGTTATVSDPHEIANVCGIEGIEFMLRSGGEVPFKFNFGAPSCVPATTFETSGYTINAEQIESLLGRDDIRYLSEMMNFPGVIYDFPDVSEKIRIAKKFNKPVDGHAPGLKGDSLKKYTSAGITTDHETMSYEEGLDKIANGMSILIREGSAAKNYKALIGLLATNPDKIMFCSDDKHPDDLVNGHIDSLIRRAIADGFDLMSVLRAAILNPIHHYSLNSGMLRIGDDADMIVVGDLKSFGIIRTYVRGTLVAENGRSLIEHRIIEQINNFKSTPKSPVDFQVRYTGGKIRVIEAIDGELITNELIIEPKVDDSMLIADTERDILKLAVINRYQDLPPAIGFIKNFSIKEGAIATSVAHDSHNIIVVGTSDEFISLAVNEVIRHKGGMAAVDSQGIISLPLQIAGLMSTLDGYQVANLYSELDKKAKQMGSGLRSSFMTLSFMALLVIPKLKLSDKGLFDGSKFEFVDLIIG